MQVKQSVQDLPRY